MSWTENRMTPKQKARYRRLSLELPAVEDKTMICPECGARLWLRLGCYGRFYGCARWRKTRCPGGVGAHDDGTPRGDPKSLHDRAACKARRSREKHNPRTSWERILDDEFDLGVQEQVA